MRGNRQMVPDIALHMRSIPAYAGEPISAISSTLGRRVYPRVCGGTPLNPGVFAPCPGLSPRMRGNQPPAAERIRYRRSIPAYAGEPLESTARLPACRVYPRVCGGTYLTASAAWSFRGLSPRMRGNLAGRHCDMQLARSIPAYAGEPREKRVAYPNPEVYPRVCGGTTGAARAVPASEGLSPRMRGNHTRILATGTVSRSIPAYAGEPHNR